MYSFQELEQLLSSSTKSILKDAQAFAEMERSASQIVSDLSGIEIDTPPADWVKQPFVWVIDFIASNRLPSISPELAKKYKDQYDQAIAMLKARAKKGINTTPHVGQIFNPYAIDEY